jgi:hypothetical protein
LSIQVLRWSGTYGQIKRKLPADHPAVIEAHRELTAARVAVVIERVMDGAPALTDEQVDWITKLVAASGIR